MSYDIKRASVGAAILDIAQRAIQDNQRPSIFKDEPIHSQADAVGGTTAGGVRQTPSAVGTGTAGANSPVLSSIPQGFNPADVVGQTLEMGDIGTPSLVRHASATPKYISGINNDTMPVYLTWAPPILDTANRWLLVNHLDTTTGLSTVEDAISSYLITRVNQASGETVTVGAVAHNEAYITAAKTYLMTNNLCTVVGSVVNIHNPPLTGGVLTLPVGTEGYFFFTDMTGQFGATYKYYIQAITSAQVESDNLEVDPIAATPDTALGLQLSAGWASSYPDLTANAGANSFADISVVVSGSTTSVELGFLPIQANALVINTAAPSGADPYVTSTNPSEIMVYYPATGTRDQIIEFNAMNCETAGGITGLTFRSGITAKTPLSTYITKKQIGATAVWVYQAIITLASTVTPGPITMMISCGNGKTTLCSAVTAAPWAPTATAGANFDATNYYAVGTSADIVITGTNLDRVNTLEIRKNTDGSLLGLATIVKQTSNYLEFTYTFASIGVYKVDATYNTPFLPTGFDVSTITLRAGVNPKGDNGTSDDDSYVGNVRNNMRTVI